MKRALPILLVLVVAAIAFWLGRQRAAAVNTTELPALVRQIQQLNELVSVKYRVQKVVGLEERKLPFGSEKLLLVVQADVLAGIDLAGLAVADVKLPSAEGIALSLPQPRVLHVVLDDKQTRVWDRQVTWWTPWVPYNPDLERQARLTAIDSIRETAIEMGILDQARRSAEQNIRRLLESLGFKAVTFAT